MRHPTLIVCGTFLLMLQPMISQTSPPVTDRQVKIIRTNILSGLDHPTVEVRASYIQTMIELKKAWPGVNFNDAIIPLMARLKSDPVPGVRILAALALHEFDSNVGRFAVSRRALYDDSERVTRVCSALTRWWHKDQQAAETPMELAAAILR